MQFSKWCLSTIAIAVALAIAELLGAPRVAIGETVQFAGVLTYHNDPMRTGQNLAETQLTPANVNVDQFGLIFSETVDGQIYAQPLYVPSVTVTGQGTHNLLIVATENDSVYAFDADFGGVPLWQKSLGTPIPSTDTSCSDLVPMVGITSTPVIDATTHVVYVVAATKDSSNPDTYSLRLHALDITNGNETSGSPVSISASVPGTGPAGDGTRITFSPLRDNQRAGLLLDNGVVYITTSSHCDLPFNAYTGWVLGYDAATLAQVVAWVDEPNGSDGGIWMSGGGIATDSSGDLYLSTGNGSFDNSGDWGDTVLRLTPSASTSPVGTLSVAQSFTPADQQSLNDSDFDLGSGGVLLLPDQSSGPTRLALTAGKGGTLYLLNRDAMGGYQIGSGGSDNVVQELPSAIESLFSTPAYFNNNIYVFGVDDDPKQFSLSAGLVSDSPVHEFDNAFAFTGSTPSISANGTSNGIVWAIGNFDADDDPCAEGEFCNAVLFAFDANDISTELYDSNMNSSRDTAGIYNKFVVPTVANGKVYVGTQGVLAAYGLLGEIANALNVTRTVVATVHPNQTHSAGTFTLKNLGGVTETLTGVDLSFSNPSLFKFAKLTGTRGGQTRSVKVVAPGSSNTFTFPKPLTIPPGKTATFTLAVNAVKGGSLPSQQTVTGIESTNTAVTGVPANLGQLSPHP